MTPESLKKLKRRIVDAVNKSNAQKALRVAELLEIEIPWED